MERAAHRHQFETTELAREIRRVAVGPFHIADAGCLGLSGGFGQHFWLGVHANGLGDVLSERKGQLACAAAQVEETSSAVEVESLGEIGEERAGITWPVARVVPGGSCEQAATGSAE